MRGIVSVTITSILSHPRRAGQERCFEIVTNTTAADGRLGCWTLLKSQRMATANVSDPNEIKPNLRPEVPSRC